MNLSSTIKSIQDIMRKDDGVDGDAQRIGQLTWMLFLKIFDQRESEWEKDSKYKSPLPPGSRWREWAGFIDEKTPKIPVDALIEYVNDNVFDQIKKMDVGGRPQSACSA